MKKLNRIYVAGHTGLIGSAIIRRLAAMGVHSVITKSRSELDLTRQQFVENFFNDERPEYVILAAGKVGGIVENVAFPANLFYQNIAIQTNVIEAAHRYNVKRLILLGSSCMYPLDCRQPLVEESLLTGKPELTSLSYALAKLAGVQMCLAYNQQFKQKKFIPVIPNSVFGPNDDFDLRSSHVFSGIMRRLHEAKLSKTKSVTLWGSGNPRREFIYVDDIADACILLLLSDLEKVELPINVGTGQDYSIQELSEIIAGIVGYKGNINWDLTKPDGAPRKILESNRIRSTGWSPRVDFEHAVKLTYEWFIDSMYNIGNG